VLFALYNPPNRKFYGGCQLQAKVVFADYLEVYILHDITCPLFVAVFPSARFSTLLGCRHRVALLGYNWCILYLHRSYEQYIVVGSLIILSTGMSPPSLALD
jgi:hypothetical protein